MNKIFNESNIQEANRRYYDEYGQYYEEYQSYFKNVALLRQWNENIQRIKSALLPLGNMKALDFGCGTGLLTFMLLELGFSVTAIDISENMLSELQKKTNRLSKDIAKRLQCIHGGIEVLERLPEESFSIICESSVLQHVHDYATFPRKCQKLLISGGVLYIGREPLHKDERWRFPLNFPLYLLFSLIDSWIINKINRGKFKEVFDPDMVPQYYKGGVNSRALIETGYKEGMEVLFKKTYNWRYTSSIFTLDNMLPRFLRYESHWNAFFDLALQKRKK